MLQCISPFQMNLAKHRHVTYSSFLQEYFCNHFLYFNILFTSYLSISLFSYLLKYKFININRSYIAIFKELTLG